jgi:hypothetical protein
MANVGYINGFPDGTYRPNEAVTANQLCQIMLNILGYDIDTTVSWATAVQAKSFSIGLLKNVSGTVGSACSRQEAAQIIYNALNMDLLQENALGVKVPSGETILTKYLNGYTATVVVTGNEKAALNDTTPLAAGKTEVDNDTILNWSTGLDEIGSSYTIWATKGGAQKNDTVVYSELSADNAYYETYEATKNGAAISAKDAGMKLTDVETFINFDDGLDDYYTADMVITYKVASIALDTKVVGNTTVKDLLISYGYDEDDLTTNFTANEVIRAGERLSDNDMAVLKYIFTNFSSDSEAVVYVGTQNNGTDISNEISFNTFKKTYLTANGDKNTVPANENGNYIKVIDNDGDGVAEYILKTEYTMDAVKSIAKNKYNLAIAKTVDGDAISTEDELAAGDVIVYALIDGVYYTNLAEVKTETIDKKGINYSKATITCGDNTYAQSGIVPTSNDDQTAFDGAFAYDIFKFDVTKAEAEETYDLYLDNYGFVRAYTENKNTYGLGLLTDAYYYTNKRTAEGQVTMVTADTEAADYDVANVEYSATKTTTAAGFIITTEDGANNATGNRGTWGRLTKFVDPKADDQTYTTFSTNVAVYAESDDGLILKETEDYTNRDMNTYKGELDVTKASLSTKVFSSKYDHTDDSKTNVETVYATTSTVYYYVTSTGVTTWTGYNNAPKSLSFDGKLDKAYAVYTESKNNGYYNAEVIVIEAKSANKNVYFAYGATARTDGKDADAITIGYSADEDAYVTDLEVAKDAALNMLKAGAYVTNDNGLVVYTPAFYQIATNGKFTTDGNAIDEDFGDYGIYATTVSNGADVWAKDYVYLADKTSFKASDVTVYKVNYNPNGNASNTFTLEETTVEKDDTVIYYATAAGVQYVIDVKQSTYKGAVIAGIQTLYTEIVNDSHVTPNSTAGKPTITFFGENATTVSHSVAKTFLESNSNTVDGSIVKVTANADKSVIKSVEITPTAATYTLTTAVATFNVTIVVESEDGNTTKVYTETLTKSVAETDATLLAVEGGNGAVVESAKVFGVQGNGTVNASQLMAMFTANTAKNATLTWKFVGNDGKTYTETGANKVDGSWDVATFKTITATVTPESGAAGTDYTFGTVYAVKVVDSRATAGTDGWTFEIDGQTSEYVVKGTTLSAASLDVVCKWNGNVYTSNDRSVDYTLNGGTPSTGNQIAATGKVTVALTAGQEVATGTYEVLQDIVITITNVY